MSTEQNPNTPQSIYDLSCDNTDKNILKKKNIRIIRKSQPKQSSF